MDVVSETKGNLLDTGEDSEFATKENGPKAKERKKGLHHGGFSSKSEKENLLPDRDQSAPSPQFTPK